MADMSTDVSFSFEWRCKETFAYYQVAINNYEPKSKRIQISFTDDWREPLWVDIDEDTGAYPIRPAPNPIDLETWEAKQGDIVEALARSEENEPFSWWQCSIQCIKNDFFLIQFK